MIDRELFAQEMALLGDRFGRSLASPTLKRYYEELSSVMDSASFAAATGIAFRTAKFWPSPAELMASVTRKSAPTLSAHEAFSKFLSSISNRYESQVDRMEKVKLIGPAAVRAVRAVGGLRAFEDMLTKDEPFVRQRFVECYELASESEQHNEGIDDALAAGDKRVAALVAKTAKSLPALSAASERPQISQT